MIGTSKDLAFKDAARISTDDELKMKGANVFDIVIAISNSKLVFRKNRADLDDLIPEIGGISQRRGASKRRLGDREKSMFNPTDSLK